MEERKAVIAIGAAQKWTDKGEKMKKITKKELEVFLRKHKLWLEDDPEGERANLSDADLRGANLSGANLSDAYLRDAYLSGAKNIYLPITCPEEGDFIGFKKAQGHIVKLKITEDAKRCSATGRKCRCSKAEVLSITNKDGSDSGVTEVRSDHDKSFIYRVGETVEEPNFCDDRWQECSPGIHFFITREEAVRY